jgi:hypothetical protein
VRRATRLARLALPLVLSSLLPAAGCAWANRDNRPLWNAFEARLVPEDETWFVVSLPLTVPGGLLAILLDTFVVHPAQVVDDALGDAGDVWDGVQWEQRYYTELAFLPVRAAVTPIVLVVAFLGRSCFDIPPHDARTPEELRRAEEQRERERADAWLAWLAALADGKTAELGHVPLPPWDDALDAAFRDARRRATATGRLALYERARRGRPPPWTAEPWMGLADPDPAIRYLELDRLDRGADVPAPLRDALRDDESALVRELARRLWP